MAINLSAIGERIQRARKLSNMSVSELAQLVHFTSKSIILAESGQADLSLEFLISLCNALEVTPNDLLETEYRSRRKQSLTEESTLAELQDLIQTLKSEVSPQAESTTKIKDTQEAIEEIRQVVLEYKMNETLNTPKTPPRKKYSHW